MSNYRIPPLPLDQLEGAAKEADALLRKYNTDRFAQAFEVFAPNGAMIGPYPSMLIIPEMIKPGIEMVAAFNKIPQPIGANREVAILVVAAKYKVAYMQYAHQAVGLEAGLGENVLKQISAGVRPTRSDEWDEQCDTAWVAADALAHGVGVLDEQIWKQLENVFGRQGTISLLQWIGFYCYMAVVLNACAVPLPEGVSAT